MNTFIIILALLLALVGIVGAIVPALPGPPIGWLALPLMYFMLGGAVSAEKVWITLVITVAVTAFDYIAPSVMTKWGGGSPAATRGATIGTLLGLFFMPWGLLIGPLAGAFVGEMMHTQNVGQSLRIALYSFLSFLMTTGLKLMLCLYFFWQVVQVGWAMIG